MSEHGGRSYRLAAGVRVEFVGPRKYRLASPSGQPVECRQRVLEVLSFAVDAIAPNLIADWLSMPHDRVNDLMASLVAAGIVEEAEPGSGPSEAPAPWRWWGEAAQAHHVAARRTRFLSGRSEVDQQKRTVLSDPEPTPRAQTRGIPVPLAIPDRRAELKAFSLLDALNERRSSAPGPATPCSLGDLASAVSETFRTRGTTATDYGTLTRKAYPTAGARHDLDAYCVWFGESSDDSSSAAFVYDDKQDAMRALAGVSTEREGWERITAQQGYAETFSGLVVVVSDTRRLAWKYRSPRAYTDIYQHTGHATQVLQSVAQALGLRTALTNAFDIDLLQTTLGLTHEELPTFVVAFAKANSADEALAGNRT